MVRSQESAESTTSGETKDTRPIRCSLVGHFADVRVSTVHYPSDFGDPILL